MPALIAASSPYFAAIGKDYIVESVSDVADSGEAQLIVTIAWLNNGSGPFETFDGREVKAVLGPIGAPLGLVPLVHRHLIVYTIQDCARSVRQKPE